MLKPVGWQVLIELEEVKEKTESGFILPTETLRNEQTSKQIGKIIAFGNTCYSGVSGIKGDTAEERAKDWGVEVGDMVYFTRFEGDGVSGDEFENLRLIVDTQLYGVEK